MDQVSPAICARPDASTATLGSRFESVPAEIRGIGDAFRSDAQGERILQTAERRLHGVDDGQIGGHRFADDVSRAIGIHRDVGRAF